MSRETDRMRKDIEARQKELLKTVAEIGDRIAIPRTTFIAGLVTGVLLLALLNRLQFRRKKK
ncbi:MAG: hypothetical protein IBX61_08825 [Thermoleophilia bacterium]|nr:hypothetical protein [Thermoleophilia bacterium]